MINLHNIKNNTGRVFLFILLLLGIFFYIKTPSNSLLATSNVCPPDYDLEQCYQYLEDQKDKIKDEKNKLNQKLKNLNSQKQDLYSKLQHINAQISSTQLQIKEIKLEIELLSVKKQQLNEQITQITEQINNYQQEINILKEKLQSIFTLKYTLNSTPWYYYISKGDLYDLFELIEVYKYYLVNNQGKIEYFKILNSQIENELKLLEEKQKQLQQTQEKIEKTTKELVKTKKDLEAKQSQQASILAQIRANEAQIKAQMSKLKSVENQVDKALTDVLLQMWAQGNLPGNGSTVAKGTIIGYQGHTGCSFGSHLHFAMYKNGAPLQPIRAGYITGSVVYGGSLYSARGRAPENGIFVTQGFHEGYAIDMISRTDGLHNGSQYCKNKYSIRCPSYIYSTSWFKSLPTNACFNQNGEGAPVYAVLGGTLYRGVDRYGSKYVLIDHGHGLVSIYYHLK